MPRYCDHPSYTLDHLKRVLTEARPAKADSRRPYVVAAKLLFLVPQQSEESVADYLARIDLHLRDTCR